MPARPIPVSIPTIHVARQITALGSTRQAELDTFLAALQRNPYDPAVMRKCEVLWDDQFSYQLPSGSVVTWRVESLHLDGTHYLLPAWDYLSIVLVNVAF